MSIWKLLGLTFLLSASFKAYGQDCKQLREQWTVLTKEWSDVMFGRKDRGGRKDSEINKLYSTQIQAVKQQIYACEKQAKEKSEAEAKNRAQKPSSPSTASSGPSGPGSPTGNSTSGGSSQASAPPTNSSPRASDPTMPPPSNPGGLIFAGTPEQQRAAEKRRQEELQRQQAEVAKQQKRQTISNLTEEVTQVLGDIAQGNQEQFAKQLQGTQEKVADFNNRGNEHQPTDDKGIMQAGRSNNSSTDDLGPGQEEDEEIEPTELNHPEAKPTENPVKSRLAESEQKVQRQRADDPSSGAGPVSTTAPEHYTTDVKTGSVVDKLIDGIQDKLWGDFTAEQKAKAAYLTYTLATIGQSIVGGLLFNINPIPAGFLLGSIAGSKAVYDQMAVTNPFLMDWPK